MKFRTILFALFCIVFVCNVCLGDDYHYSVGVTNAMPDAKLFLTPFPLYTESPQMGVPSTKSIEGTSVVDSFTKEPDSQIKLTWKVKKGDSVKKYSRTVKIDLPKQFKEENLSGINFVFYDAQVLVVYGSSSEYSKKTSDSVGGFDSEAHFIFSDGTPYTLRDFEEYIKENPKGSFDSFRKSQKKKYKK